MRHNRYCKSGEDDKVSFGVNNVLPHKVTIPKDTSIARMTILNEKQGLITTNKSSTPN